MRLALLLSLSACAAAPADPSFEAFVADERAGTISVFQVPFAGGVASVSLEEARDGGAVTYLPHNVQASPDGQTVWITAASWEFYTRGYAGLDDEQLIVLDAARRTVRARIPLQGLLAHVVFDPAGRFAYVTASTLGHIVEFDAATLRETRRFVIGPRRGPHGARVCGGRVFVANSVGRSVAWVDLASGQITEVRVDGSPLQVACTPDGATVYTAVQGRAAAVRVDVATRMVETLALPDSARGPAQVYLSPDGARLWIADQGSLTATDRAGRQVFEVDLPRWALARSAEVGLGAHGVVVSPDGARVLVTSALENVVSVLDAATLRTEAVVPVGRAPNGITLRALR